MNQGNEVFQRAVVAYCTSCMLIYVALKSDVTRRYYIDPTWNDGDYYTAILAQARSFIKSNKTL